MATVTLVYHTEGDWEALYVDGVLEEEGHSVNLRFALEALVGKTVDAVRTGESEFLSGRAEAQLSDDISFVENNR